MFWAYSHSHMSMMWLLFLTMHWEWEGDNFSVTFDRIFMITALIYDFLIIVALPLFYGLFIYKASFHTHFPLHQAFRVLPWALQTTSSCWISHFTSTGEYSAIPLLFSFDLITLKLSHCRIFFSYRIVPSNTEEWAYCFISLLLYKLRICFLCIIFGIQEWNLA